MDKKLLMLEQTIKALSLADLGYDEDRDFAASQKREGQLWKETGVLMMLTRADDEYCFVLNKRSQNVSQPGDLCWPGGHPQACSDIIMSRLVIPYMLPMRRDPGYMAAKKRSAKTFGTISYFLASALRETWEEMGIGPRRLQFLGALPAYRLILRKKIVFPMVGFLARPKAFKTGWEIEKNVLLPFSYLFNHDRYGTYTLKMTGKYKKMSGVDSWDAPCFAVMQEDGSEEILWGATYKMLMSFMKIVYDFEPPESGPVRAQAELYPSRA